MGLALFLSIGDGPFRQDCRQAIASAEKYSIKNKSEPKRRSAMEFPLILVHCQNYGVIPSEISNRVSPNASPSPPFPSFFRPPEGQRELAAARRHLEAREEAVRDTGREVGLSLDQGRSVLGRERDKLRDEAESLGRVSEKQLALHPSGRIPVFRATCAFLNTCFDTQDVPLWLAVVTMTVSLVCSDRDDFASHSAVATCQSLAYQFPGRVVLPPLQRLSVSLHPSGCLEPPRAVRLSHYFLPHSAFYCPFLFRLLSLDFPLPRPLQTATASP